MLVALRGGAGAPRIDADDARAVAFARFAQEMPMVMSGREYVHAPKNNQFGVAIILRVKANGVASAEDGNTGCAANIAMHIRSAEGIQQAHGSMFLHGAHGAEKGHRHQRFCAMLGDDLVKAPGDGIDRLFPRNALELAIALGAGAAQRME
jgi:hypothetical protein